MSEQNPQPANNGNQNQPNPGAFPPPGQQGFGGQQGQPIPPKAPTSNTKFWTPGVGNPGQQPNYGQRPGQPFAHGQQSRPGQPFVPGQQANSAQPQAGPQFSLGQPQPGGSAPFQPGGPAGKAPSKTNRKTLLIVGGVIIGLIVLAVIVSIVFRVVRKDPYDVVKEYANAVASGDVDKALGYLDLEGLNVLPKEAMEGALEEGEIEITDIVGTTMGKSYHSAVTYTYNGESDIALVNLTNNGNAFAPKWEVSDGALGQLTVVGDEGSAVNINGVDVAPGAYQALPGSYAVSAGSNIFYDSDSDAQNLSWGGYEYASGTLTVSDAGGATVKKVLDTKVDECLGQGTFEPKDCPFSYNYFGDDTKVSDIKWKRTGESDVWVYADTADTVNFSYSVDTELTYKTSENSSDETNSDYSYLYFSGKAKLVGENQIELTFD